ncbi:MAG: substrate-binding domain-containing protein [Myxococcaceae bacterium]
MRKVSSAAVVVLSCVLGGGFSALAAPPVTGTPLVDAPTEVLLWPVERGEKTPSLTEASANVLNDLHTQISDCEMSFTTAGNYHMALRELWPIYLASFPAEAPLRNWMYSTSPPIVRQQINNGVVQFGNADMKCRPQAAAAPIGVMNNLAAARLTDGAPVPVIKNRGNVILVKKGNPKHISSVWDLGRPNVRVVTPNPTSEPGSFTNYSNSIYNIALNDPSPRFGMTAEQLFNSIFNVDPNSCPASHHEDEDGDDHGHGHGQQGNCRPTSEKWLTGTKIHHREVPWSIAYGRGDASVIFYHLALYFVRTFPDQFEIVPLGGTADDPQPVAGNPVEVTYLVKLAGPFSARQLEATAKLVEAYQRPEFTTILQNHGLSRP